MCHAELEQNTFRVLAQIYRNFQKLRKLIQPSSAPIFEVDYV